MLFIKHPIFILALSIAAPFSSLAGVDWEDSTDSEISELDETIEQRINFPEERRFALSTLQAFKNKQTAKAELEKNLFGYDSASHCRELLAKETDADTDFEQYLDFKASITELLDPFRSSFLTVQLEPLFVKKAVIPLAVVRVGNQFLDITFGGQSIKTIDGLSPIDYLISQNKIPPIRAVEKNQALNEINYLYKVDAALRTIWEKSCDPAAEAAECIIEYEDPALLPMVKTGMFVDSKTPIIASFIQNCLPEITSCAMGLLRSIKPSFSSQVREKQFTKIITDKDNLSSSIGLVSIDDICLPLKQDKKSALGVLKELLELNFETEHLILDLRSPFPSCLKDRAARVLSKMLSGAQFQRHFTQMFSVSEEVQSWAKAQKEERKAFLEEANIVSPNHRAQLEEEIASLEKLSQHESGSTFECPIIAPIPLFDCPKVYNQPITVIVDHTTSGFSEVLASLLQSQGATIVGEKTQGEPTESDLCVQRISHITQTVVASPFSTIYSHPKGQEKTPLNYVGIQPDHILKKGLLDYLTGGNAVQKTVELISSNPSNRKNEDA